jgi:lipopolysaccharide/colanic/teichoic acid biosynthesis glycosyltransferase
MKRAFDFLVASTALVVLSPVFGAIAAAVKVTDPAGPVLFAQERVGRRGRLFKIHKFRSMRVGAAGLQVTSAQDARITPVGQVIRKTKLDELPQLWDVLVGNMSLVGPRPEVPKYVAHWPAEARDIILSVRPGITDPASVRWRNEAEELATATDPERHYIDVILPEKARMYVDYVRSRTFVGDLKVLVSTLAAVGRG